MYLIYALAYDRFINPFVDRDYYLYNYTNVKNALENGDKLDVYEVDVIFIPVDKTHKIEISVSKYQKVGPVRFRRYRHKFDLTYPTENGTDVIQYLGVFFVLHLLSGSRFCKNETIFNHFEHFRMDRIYLSLGREPDLYDERNDHHD